jgi:cell wall-associated NlpC family hydrolase
MAAALRLASSAREDAMTEDEFRALGSQHLGKWYIFGADGPDTFDCSGLVQVMLATLSLDPRGDQSANGLYRHFRRPGRSAPIAPAAAVLGDLIFYGRRTRVGHCAIGWGNGDMFEAGGGGEETISIQIARRQNAKVRIARIDRRRDVVAVLRPTGLPWAE